MITSSRPPYVPLVLAGLLVVMAAVFVTAQPPAQSVNTPLFDGGTAWQPRRTATIANMALATTLTARNIAGAAFTEKASRWMVVSQPAANSQGSASIAAEAAVRHVVDCIAFSADASAAVTAAAGTFVVRDGATGAGTVIWSYAVAHQVAAGAGIQTVAPVNFCGLNLVGTTNTAMTAEFNAGVTGEVQGANISGFNIQ